MNIQCDFTDVTHVTVQKCTCMCTVGVSYTMQLALMKFGGEALTNFWEIKVG